MPEAQGTERANAGPSPAIGDVIAGKYRLVRHIEEGGMGAVWEALHVELQMPVAIKVLRAELAGRAFLLERLLEEARALARLRHPAIVSVTDVGRQPDGAPFVVMELLSGENLSDELARRGRIAPDKAVRCLLPIADAMGFAHANGIVHRDLKPSNIMLCRAGQTKVQPKIIDFGVARNEFAEGRHRTQVGVLVGSPQYMAPEQIESKGAGPAADVWAFSVVLYELIAGVPPFDADSLVALANLICSAAPAPLAVDPELWAIIERGLEKQPADRWRDFQSLGEALASWLLSTGVTEDITGAAIAEAWAPRSKERRGLLDSDPPPDDVWMQMVREAQQRRAGSSRPTQTSAAPAASLAPAPTGFPPRSRPRLKSEAAAPSSYPDTLPGVAAAPPSEPSLPSADPPAVDPKLAQVRALLASARSARRTGKLDDACRFIARAMEAATTAPAAELLGDAWGTIDLILSDGAGAALRLAMVVGPSLPSTVSTEDVFLASRVDGLTLREAIDALGMEPPTAIRKIARLRADGVVAIRR